MGVSIFYALVVLPLFWLGASVKIGESVFFYAQSVKKIRASVKTSVKMSNATLKRLGSRRPRLKTPIFTMKNEHFLQTFYARL